MNAKIKIISFTARLITLFGLCSNVAFAQTQVPAPTQMPAPAPSVVKIAGVVQFADGRSVKTDVGAQTELVYQSGVYENDRIETTRGSSLKIAARNGCKFVMRGETAASAPIDKKPWRFKGESLRAICTNGATVDVDGSVLVGISGTAVKITSGEVLAVTEKSANPSTQLLVLSGVVQVRNQTLAPHKLYALDANAVTEVNPQPSEDDLRALNTKHAPPRESATWPKPAPPPEPSNVRLMFGPAISYGRVDFDNNDLGENKIKGNGPRIQMQIRTSREKSLLFAVSWIDSDDGDNGYQPGDGAHNRIDHLLLEAGERFNHDRWWSPFYRVGLGFTTDDLNVHRSFSYSSHYKYEFYVASASIGVDAHWVPKFIGGLGFYSSIEGQVVESLWRGARLDKGNYGPVPIDEPWRLTALNALLSFGVLYEF